TTARADPRLRAAESSPRAADRANSSAASHAVAPQCKQTTCLHRLLQLNFPIALARFIHRGDDLLHAAAFLAGGERLLAFGHAACEGLHLRIEEAAVAQGGDDV